MTIHEDVLLYGDCDCPVDCPAIEGDECDCGCPACWNGDPGLWRVRRIDDVPVVGGRL